MVVLLAKKKTARVGAAATSSSAPNASRRNVADTSTTLRTMPPSRFAPRGGTLIVPVLDSSHAEELEAVSADHAALSTARRHADVAAAAEEVPPAW